MGYQPVKLSALASVNPAAARKIILEALVRGYQNKEPGGTEEHAAKELGIGRNTLRRLMQRLKVRAPGDRRKWVKSQGKDES